MDKVIVRTRALSQALFSLATAGCDTIEVSVVEHAVKVEGIRDDERLPLNIWSKEPVIGSRFCTRFAEAIPSVKHDSLLCFFVHNYQLEALLYFRIAAT